MRRIGKIGGMRGLGPGGPAKSKRQRLVEAFPKNKCPEGDPCLGDKEMAQPPRRQPDLAGDTREGDRLIDMPADLGNGLDDPCIGHSRMRRSSGNRRNRSSGERNQLRVLRAVEIGGSKGFS